MTKIIVPLTGDGQYGEKRGNCVLKRIQLDTLGAKVFNWTKISHYEYHIQRTKNGTVITY